MDENRVPPSSSPPASPAAVPPPLQPPPLVVQAPRRRNGWRIAAVVLAVLLILSVLSQLGFLVSSALQGWGGMGYSAGPQLEEVVLEFNRSANKIAVVPVEGLIFSGNVGPGGYGMVRYIEDQLEIAGRDARVKAVLVKINSPGGEVLASDEINRAIAKFQKETGKPVVASMGSVAASGGYYVAAPCRWIVANELTITGSIGVILHNYNYRGLLNKVGVKPMVYKSGRFKNMLGGDRELQDLTPQEQETLEMEEAMIQRLVDKTYGRFKQVVAEGRAAANKLNQGNASAPGRALAEDWEEYVDGRVWSGDEAFEHGFVDEVGDWDAAVRRAQALAGIADANLVHYQQPFGFSNLFRLLGESKAGSIKVDFGVDLAPLQPGLLYFLSPTYLR